DISHEPDFPGKESRLYRATYRADSASGGFRRVGGDGRSKLAIDYKPPGLSSCIPVRTRCNRMANDNRCLDSTSRDPLTLRANHRLQRTGARPARVGSALVGAGRSTAGYAV